MKQFIKANFNQCVLETRKIVIKQTEKIVYYDTSL
jgi:hypothetical protein